MGGGGSRGGWSRGGGGGRGNSEMDRPWVTPGLRQEILKTKVLLEICLDSFGPIFPSEPGNGCQEGKVCRGCGSSRGTAGENGSIARGSQGHLSKRTLT